MIKPKLGNDRIALMNHAGKKIIELNFASRSVADAESLVYDYAFLLSSLRKGEKALVLVDFNEAVYDSRLALAWKARLDLFSERVEKSAVIGANRLAATAVKGFAATASLIDRPLGPHRAILFTDREKALDWLAGGQNPE